MLCNDKNDNYISDEKERWYVSKFSHTVKGVFEEADLIVFDKKNKETFLFEIKHSNESHEQQVIHLESKDFIDYIEKHFGPVKNCIVLYNGENDVSKKTPRLNIADFLNHIYRNFRDPHYSIKHTISHLCNYNKEHERRSKRASDKSHDGGVGM